MTELDTMIRKAVHERVDRAPMPPDIESIEALDRTGSSITSHRPRRGVLVGAGLVALVALLAGLLVTARLTSDHSQVSVDTTLAPAGKPATPLVGRSLPARYGLPNGVPGYHFLTMELDRPVGLAADDVAYVPTGPLGPMYAQSIRIDYDPSGFALPDTSGFAVLTVLPEEQAAVIAAASGDGPTHTATLGSRQVTVAEPWSATGNRMTDNRAVTWVQDGAAIIVTATPTITEQQLLAAAAAVTTIPTVPLLPPVAADAKGSGVVPASYSLTPRPGVVPDANLPLADGTPWPELIYGEPLSAAMGKVVVHGSDGGDHYTLRELGDPASNTVLLASSGFGQSTDQVTHGPMWMVFSVGDGLPPLPKSYAVRGAAPDSVTGVEIVLDDGTTLDGPTYDEGLGWPARPFLIVVPDDRQVVRFTARSADGTVVYTRDLETPDGSHPGKDTGYGMADYTECGHGPMPQYPTLDC